MKKVFLPPFRLGLCRNRQLDDRQRGLFLENGLASRLFGGGVLISRFHEIRTKAVE